MSVEKPAFPKNTSGWWKKRMDELTEQQQQIKRDYYRQYNLWKKAQREPGVNLSEELTEEEKKERRREYKRRYYHEKAKEYHHNYHKKRYAEDPEYVQRCKESRRKQLEKVKHYNELLKSGEITPRQGVITE